MQKSSDHCTVAISVHKHKFSTGQRKARYTADKKFCSFS